MSDQTSRFETAAQQAKRNFEEARRRFSGSEGKQDGALGRVRGWSSQNLPGGEKSLWIIIVLILLAVFVWWLLPGKSARDMGRGMGGPQPVGVAAAERGSIDVTLNALGTVTPLATVTVRPQVSGQIVRFAFQEGQMVKAGDLLAEIDPRSFQAALEQTRGQLARDQAMLTNARLDLKRQQGLRAANATSQQALDTQATQVKQYEGVVMSDQANVDAAAINLGYTRVTSPVAGRVGIRTVDVGNFVSAGQSSGIVVVTQLQPISVLFTVTEDNVRAVVARLNSGEDLQVEAYDRSQTNKLATGRLSAVDTQVDTTTGTVKLRAMFDNEDGMLFPNQFVNVRLLVDTLRNQVVIPVAAVQRGAEGTFVFVVKSDKTVSMRTVTLGKQQGDRVAVSKGLNPGETVVTDGADRLREGGEVSIPSGQKVAKVDAADNASAPGGQAARDVQRAQRRAQMQKACGDDIKKLCGSFQGPQVFMCLRDNRDSLSEPCQTAMKNMRGRRGGGEGGGPPPGGPPPGGP
jgi:multidrug efflux system membrane fusion protein